MTAPEPPIAQAASATQCAPVAIVAARGSDQERSASQFDSTGWEGENIAELLAATEARYPGSIAPTPIIAVDYPAAMGLPNASQGELSLAFFAPLMPDPVGAILQRFTDSVESGRATAAAQIAAFEKSTGCHPTYVFIGYSQGAVVLAPLATDYAADDRLAGAIFFGNPLQRRGDDATVGARHGESAAIDLLGAHHADTLRSLDSSLRLNYCLEGDPICNFTPQNAITEFGNGLATHASYFLTPRPEDDIVADRLHGLLTGD